MVFRQRHCFLISQGYIFVAQHRTGVACIRGDDAVGGNEHHIGGAAGLTVLHVAVHVFFQFVHALGRSELVVHGQEGFIQCSVVFFFFEMLILGQGGGKAVGHEFGHFGPAVAIEHAK